MDENVKKYILYGVIAVVILLFAFFVFRKKEKKTNNLYTALKATGVVEGFNMVSSATQSGGQSINNSIDVAVATLVTRSGQAINSAMEVVSSATRSGQQPIQSGDVVNAPIQSGVNQATSRPASGGGYQQRCQGVLPILFGKDSDGGLDKIYEDVMGKKIPIERMDCNGKTPDEIETYLRKIMTLIDEMTVAILKNTNIKKRNNDLVSAWVILNYGIGQIVMPGQFKLNVQGDREAIKTIEFGVRDGQQQHWYTPSVMISTSEIETASSTSSTSRAMMNTALPYVNQAEINQLKADKNTKIPVDQLAQCIIYQLAKRGSMNLFN